jgi:hypothetical protein
MDLCCLCIQMPIIYPCMLIIIFIFLLFIDGARKKEETLIYAKIGIVMPLLVFQFNAQIQGGVSLFFDELSRFISNKILFVLSSITKKGDIENASRPIIDFGD